MLFYFCPVDKILMCLTFFNILANSIDKICDFFPMALEIIYCNLGIILIVKCPWFQALTF